MYFVIFCKRQTLCDSLEPFKFFLGINRLASILPLAFTQKKVFAIK